MTKLQFVAHTIAAVIAMVALAPFIAYWKLTGRT